MAVIVISLIRSRRNKEGETAERIFTNISVGDKGIVEGMNRSEAGSSPMRQPYSGPWEIPVFQPGRAL